MSILYCTIPHFAAALVRRDRADLRQRPFALIDPEGRILHQGDVEKQLDRTLENMEALLDRAGATLGDMSSFIVYVRDPSDHSVAWRRMRQRVDGAPVQVVQASVCRPGWLIEVEGTAVISAANPGLPTF